MLTPFDVKRILLKTHCLLLPLLTSPSFLPMPQFYHLQDKDEMFHIYLTELLQKFKRISASSTNG